MTPAHIQEAGRTAITRGWTKYTPNTGILELREAICAWYRTAYDAVFDPRQVIVTAGGKQALFNVAMAIVDAGDEVITHAPGWPTIVEQIRLAGGRPVVVRTHPEDRFKVHASAVTDVVGPRTRAIVINTPGNPTGGLLSEGDLEAIARAASARGLWVVLDLCYEQLVHDDAPHSLPRLLQQLLPERFVLVGSLSKSYAMTGWRCGWAIGPEPLIAACNTIQSHATSNVSSVSQHAAVAALSGPQACVAEMRQSYRARLDAMLKWLAPEPRLRCVRPAGAFYLLPDVSAWLTPDTVRTSCAVRGRVAVPPLRRDHAGGGVRCAGVRAVVLRRPAPATGARCGTDSGVSPGARSWRGAC